MNEWIQDELPMFDRVCALCGSTEFIARHPLYAGLTESVYCAKCHVRYEHGRKLMGLAGEEEGECES